jgi:hypothetical protein
MAGMVEIEITRLDGCSGELIALLFAAKALGMSGDLLFGPRGDADAVGRNLPIAVPVPLHVRAKVFAPYLAAGRALDVGAPLHRHGVLAPPALHGLVTDATRIGQSADAPCHLDC